MGSTTTRGSLRASPPNRSRKPTALAIPRKCALTARWAEPYRESPRERRSPCRFLWVSAAELHTAGRTTFQNSSRTGDRSARSNPLPRPTAIDSAPRKGLSHDPCPCPCDSGNSGSAPSSRKAAVSRTSRLRTDSYHSTLHLPCFSSPRFSSALDHGSRPGYPQASCVAGRRSTITRSIRRQPNAGSRLFRVGWQDSGLSTQLLQARLNPRVTRESLQQLLIRGDGSCSVAERGLRFPEHHLRIG